MIPELRTLRGDSQIRNAKYYLDTWSYTPTGATVAAKTEEIEDSEKDWMLDLVELIKEPSSVRSMYTMYCNRERASLFLDYIKKSSHMKDEYLILTEIPPT